MAKRRTLILIPTVAVLSALMLAGCSSGSSSSDGAPVDQSSKGISQDSLQDVDGASERSLVAAGGELSEKPVAPESDSAEILTASLSIRVKDPQKIAAELRTVATDAGGSVSYSIETPGSEYEYGSAQITLRIPPEKLQSTIEAAKAYGVVVSSESGSQDVSKQKTDYEIRITGLRTSVDRLNGLLAASQSTADLIEIERELQARQTDLESMEANLAALNDSIDFSTLSITLTAENKDSAPQRVDPESFASGFQRGLDSVIAFGAGSLVFIGSALPWIILLLIVGSIAKGIAVLLKRRRRAAVVSQPIAPQKPASTPAEPTEPKTEKSTEDGREEEG